MRGILKCSQEKKLKSSTLFLLSNECAKTEGLQTFTWGREALLVEF